MEEKGHTGGVISTGETYKAITRGGTQADEIQPIDIGQTGNHRQSMAGKRPK